MTWHHRIEDAMGLGRLEYEHHRAEWAQDTYSQSADRYNYELMSTSGMVRVPASSANLGPGFDTLGLALDIHLECRFRIAEKLLISARGRDVSSIPCDETNLIWQTAVRVGAMQNKEMPPIEMELSNDIPVGKGLGSSAAALLTGVAIANCVLDLKWNRQRILDVAAKLEGHPDNVAAAVLGSFVAATIDSEGRTNAIRIDFPTGFRVAVLCPDYELDTEHMRSFLPDSYSKEDTVFNLQRATLLVAALAAGNTDVFPECLRDRLHQPYRSSSIPGMESILALRAPGLLGCALSGAGPALVVFYEDGSETVVDLVQQQFSSIGRNSEILLSHIDQTGLQTETND